MPGWTTKDGNQILLKAIKTPGSGARFPAGSAVGYNIATDDGMSIRRFNAHAVDHFAGVLDENCAADGLVHDNALIAEGLAKVQFLQHALSTVGSWARPVPGRTYMTYANFPTGIILTVDMTATPGEVVYPEEATPAIVNIMPNCVMRKLVMYADEFGDGPLAADADGVIAGFNPVALDLVCTAADIVAGGGTATLDVARNLIARPVTNTGDVAAGTVTFVGTDAYGAAATEALTFTANQTEPEITAMAFASIATITWSGVDGDTATWDIGWQNILGLPFLMKYALVPYPDKVSLEVTAGNYGLELTPPTIAASATVIESNTVELNGALTGTGAGQIAGIGTDQGDGKVLIELPY